MEKDGQVMPLSLHTYISIDNNSEKKDMQLWDATSCYDLQDIAIFSTTISDIFFGIKREKNIYYMYESREVPPDAPISFLKNEYESISWMSLREIDSSLNFFLIDRNLMDYNFRFIYHCMNFFLVERSSDQIRLVVGNSC